MSASIVAVSPDVGFPWICWPVAQVGAIEFSGANISTYKADMPADPWVLSPVTATLPGGYATAEGIIQAQAAVGGVQCIRLTASGRVRIDNPDGDGGTFAFTTSALSRRFGFSLLGPHPSGATGDIEPVGGVWWAPHTGSIYGERDDRRVASLEPAAGAPSAISVWGTVRRGVLRSPLLHRARVYDDAMVDARYRTPAGVTATAPHLPDTAEAALTAAASGMPWRVHLRTPGLVYRDVWITDPAVLASVDAIADEQDAGRRITVTVPVVVVAP